MWWAYDGQIDMETTASCLISMRDEHDSSRIGEARAAFAHFEGVIRQNLGALVLSFIRAIFDTAGQPSRKRSRPGM
ncbi:hypothetical protein CHX26_08945 [Porphyrobacter sp. HT-58-2]|uniref:hypothetical protein n=1 Tax=Porphyrobacter sp. HT-58-2 TaxID=2023229 RepID=UPI000CDC68A5|nr:hypothetical protein [Porphyrobacter sp. HT-58-2]AUX69603.1 hypothetical protein CHX26_08945 [Porphyrobacter sp. HT-58-2]